MTNQNIQLEIGDEIGFVQLKNDIDSIDEILFFPIVEISLIDGEKAYRYMYPDGEISRTAVRQSQLKHRIIRINRYMETAAPTKGNSPNLAICLSDRKDEFKAALKRALDNEFTVYAGWDRDTFFARNESNGNEYRVEFETIDGKTFAECECKDFYYRKRICKHIAGVLQETIFGINLAV